MAITALETRATCQKLRANVTISAFSDLLALLRKIFSKSDDAAVDFAIH
jgi:hypothetical protein